MSKNHATSKPAQAPQKQPPAAGGRVFKSPLKNVPQVTAEMWAKVEAAARTPGKDRHYPVMIEAPDA